MTSIYEQWVVDNREALESALAKQFETLTDLSKGRVTNGELAEAAIDEIQEAASQEADTPSVGSWDAVVEAVNAYAEQEGVVIEGWVLAIEQSTTNLWDAKPVRVFGPKDTTDVHAVGILALAGDVAKQTGVEG